MTILTPDEREALWETIALVRDGAPRTPDDADTDDIIDAVLDSGLFVRFARRAKAEAWDEGYDAGARSEPDGYPGNPYRD